MLFFPGVCNLHKHSMFFLRPSGPFVQYSLRPKEKWVCPWMQWCTLDTSLWTTNNARLKLLLKVQLLENRPWEMYFTADPQTPMSLSWLQGQMNSFLVISRENSYYCQWTPWEISRGRFFKESKNIAGGSRVRNKPFPKGANWRQT